jgi:DNA-3-methyladenine glycosylase
MREKVEPKPGATRRRTKRTETRPGVSGGRLKRSEYALDSPTLAQELLGRQLVRVLDDGTRLSGIIVETEAYVGAMDRAAHSYNLRRTPRNEAMYAKPGTAYVYFTYGMHHCVNVVCGREGEPVAVLIRALEPVEGIEIMQAARSLRGGSRPLRETELCSGPGKLCQALRIDRTLNGLDMVLDSRLWIESGDLPAAGSIVNAARVGVDSAGEWALAPLRWYVEKNPNVSVRLKNPGRATERICAPGD